ncbi:MAG: hypothetical protein KME08_14445 [Aphanothece sp. CMT-3BRIN-NPC111]|nr:hypothetical protein [Aphanothece sp. CMT-3BRIN-NPC111]
MGVATNLLHPDTSLVFGSWSLQQFLALRSASCLEPICKISWSLRDRDWHPFNLTWEDYRQAAPSFQSWDSTV